MLKYYGVIFDLDGVICHTDQFHYKAWKIVADRMGIYFDEEINNRLRGVSRMESLEIILERYDGTLSQAQKLKLAEEKNDHYVKLLMQMDESYLAKEVIDTINALRGQGVKLAIGSSSKNAELILRRLILWDFFDVVCDGRDISYSKPHPEVFLLAAKKLRIEPVNCLVVEDAHAGVEAALAGGFDCAGIGDAASFEGVTYRLNSLDEILDIE